MTKVQEECYWYHILVSFLTPMPKMTLGKTESFILPALSVAHCLQRGDPSSSKCKDRIITGSNPLRASDIPSAELSPPAPVS